METNNMKRLTLEDGTVKVVAAAIESKTADEELELKTRYMYDGKQRMKSKVF